MMKKILLVILVLVLYAGAMASAVVCWPEEETTDTETTRLMRVEWWDTTQDGATVLRDEEGYEWVIDAIAINSDDVMVEIDNNNTPNRYWDDVVVNVWQSAIWVKEPGGVTSGSYCVCPSNVRTFAR